jgi:aryl-alcohol dehydrogenase-like predicted oxidoreductase
MEEAALTAGPAGANLATPQHRAQAAMEIRNLGRSGLRVSAIGLGCNNFGGRIDLEGTRKVIHKALDLGITLFDTADVYGNRGGSETEMGQVLHADERKRIVLASKFGMPMDDVDVKLGGSRHYIMQAVEDSLRRLRTDWLDLYQIHQPDPRTPIEETLRALDDLVRQGKVRYIGCSNFPAWQVVEAQWTAKANGLNAFVSCQDEYSLLVRNVVEPQLRPAMLQYDMGLLPFFPLASGVLTGKYRRNAPLPSGTRLANTARLADRYLTERNWPVAERLGDFAEQCGRTLLELAFSWLLAQAPVSSVIAGATRPDQLEQNVQAGGWVLTAAELAEVDKITAG